MCSDFEVDPDTGELCLKPGVRGLREVLYFDNPGLYQFNKANYPWLARVRVRAIGGGGGSASANAAANELVAAGGGAGGGYSESVLEASALGATETIAVGAGGTAGLGSNNPGGDGGNSSFGGFVLAYGGGGALGAMTSGTAADIFPGRGGPPAGIGQIAVPGEATSTALRLNAAQGQAAYGGGSHLGTGGGGRTSAGPGIEGHGYGGGASGALSRGSQADPQDGAPGADGLVIIELYA